MKIKIKLSIDIKDIKTLTRELEGQKTDFTDDLISTVLKKINKKIRKLDHKLFLAFKQNPFSQNKFTDLKKISAEELLNEKNNYIKR